MREATPFSAQLLLLAEVLVRLAVVRQLLALMVVVVVAALVRDGILLVPVVVTELLVKEEMVEQPLKDMVEVAEALKRMVQTLLVQTQPVVLVVMVVMDYRL